MVSTGQTNGPASRVITVSPDLSYNPDTSASIAVMPASIAKLQLIVPGEVAAPGVSAGKNNTPTSRIAGSSFNVTVRSVDQYWNLNSAGAASVNIESSDPFMQPAAPTSNLSGGVKTIAITLRKARTDNSDINPITHTIGVYSSDTPAWSSMTVTGIPITPNNAQSLLQIVLPGETAAPGHPNGKTGSPAPLQAGANLAVTVNATDNQWNRIAGVSHSMLLSSPADIYSVIPPAVAMTEGQCVFSDATAYKPYLATVQTLHVDDQDITPPIYASTTTLPFTVTAAPANRFQVLLPNQANQPGRWSGAFTNAGSAPYGKVNSVQARTAGSSFVATVNACDTYWNIASTDVIVQVLPMVNAGTQDTFAAVSPSTASLVNTSTHTVTFFSGGTFRYVEALPYTGGLLMQLSEGMQINADLASRLQLLVNGETPAPGKPPYSDSTGGKNGAPLKQTAGTAFNITVRVTDPYHNTATPAGNPDITVRLTSDDTFDKSFDDQHLNTGNSYNLAYTWTLITATTNGWTLSGDDIAPNTYDTAFSLPVKVNPHGDDAGNGFPRKLQVLLPGETAVPGKYNDGINSAPYGKSGIPLVQTAGTAYPVTVNAVDFYWNRVDDALYGISPLEGNPGVHIVTSDLYDTDPADNALVNGIRVFSAMAVTAGTFTVTASDIYDSQYLPYTTSVATAIAATPATQLQIIMPGETAVPGKWNNGLNSAPYGKSGLPLVQTAGAAFTITVNGCDQYWNRCQSGAANVHIAATDPFYTPPADKSLVNGQTTISLTLVSVGTNTLTASDSNAVLNPYSVTGVTVTPNVPVQLQVLVPGETNVGGKPSGKQGSSATQMAGAPFLVTVNACDTSWNKTSTFTVVSLTASDSHSSNPAPLSLVNGSTYFMVTLVCATDAVNWNNAGWTLTANAPASTMSNYVSAAVPVAPIMIRTL